MFLPSYGLRLIPGCTALWGGVATRGGEGEGFDSPAVCGYAIGYDYWGGGGGEGVMSSISIF